MKKKIKITEKQFNMIVESIIKKNINENELTITKTDMDKLHSSGKVKIGNTYVEFDETLNEEQLEEGKLAKIAGALAILAASIYPGLKKQQALAQMQKEYPELVQKVQDETPFYDTSEVILIQKDRKYFEDLLTRYENNEDDVVRFLKNQSWDSDKKVTKYIVPIGTKQISDNPNVDVPNLHQYAELLYPYLRKLKNFIGDGKYKFVSAKIVSDKSFIDRGTSLDKDESYIVVIDKETGKEHYLDVIRAEKCKANVEVDSEYLMDQGGKCKISFVDDSGQKYMCNGETGCNVLNR